MSVITKSTFCCKLRKNSKWLKSICSFSYNTCEFQKKDRCGNGYFIQQLDNVIKDFGSFHLSALSYSVYHLSPQDSSFRITRLLQQLPVSCSQEVIPKGQQRESLFLQFRFRSKTFPEAFASSRIPFTSKWPELYQHAISKPIITRLKKLL